MEKRSYPIVPASLHMTRFLCTGCGKRVKAPRTAVGRDCACRNCHARLIVPSDMPVLELADAKSVVSHAVAAQQPLPANVPVKIGLANKVGRGPLVTRVLAQTKKEGRKHAIRGGRALLGGGVALAIVALVCGFAMKGDPVQPTSPKGWPKVEQRLKEFDGAADEAASKRLNSVKQYLTQRQKGADPFAAEVLSLSGKWELAKDVVGAGDHRRYVAETFDQYLFSAADVKAVVLAAVKGYLTDLDGLENNLLVQLRADLGDGELGRLPAGEHFKSDEAFRAEYRRLTATLLPEMADNLKFTAGREVLALIAMDVATQVGLDVGASVAAELGLDATILSSGVVGGITTLGVGLVVGFVIDAIIDWVLREVGYDPEAVIARQVRESVDRLADRLIDGDATVQRAYGQLLQKASSDENVTVRDTSRQAAERLERDGGLGLKSELRRIQEIRACLRQEALRKLLSGTENP